MAQGKYTESISISKVKDMDYKDYSEYNEVENEVNSKDLFMLTSEQERVFANKLRRYADKIDGVKLP